MIFKAKVYKLGKSGRLAVMLPKEVVFVPGEYDVEIKGEPVPEVPVEPVATVSEVVEDTTPEETIEPVI